jgi:diguanylate cyclase (GGDEF)-like protein
MVDVDHFKKFNDTYGHDCGDQVLRMVASKLMQVPGGGQAFRYGGEEFAIIFSGKSANDAVLDLEHLRQTIADAPFIVRGGDRRKKKARSKGNSKAPRKTHVTVSIGVAERDEKHAFTDQVVEAADKALYRAKEMGRNRVEC